MKIELYSLYRALLRDLGVSKKTTSYVLRRLRCEGAYFVTTLLPSFAKHVLACYEAGRWTTFGSSIHEVGGLPKIFRVELLGLFVLRDDVYIARDDADPVSLYVIRQLCEYCYKLALPFTADQLNKATTAFVACEQELSSEPIDDDFVDTMRKRFETFYPHAKSVTLDQVAANARPGPGTFSGCNPRNFWMRNYRHPYVRDEFGHLSFGLRFNRRAPKADVRMGDPDYSEVLFVPKDSRGPRTIVREPYDRLLFQMGYNTLMSRSLEQDTQNRINFASQDINKNLARDSSIDRTLCTLDLKDASDRVQYSIVRRIFRHLPLLKVVETFRTPQAKLPDGSSIRLNKLSGMGSGFTFPTMALIIHLAICTHVSRSLRIPYKRVMREVYVYGDDIIVPTAWRLLAVQALEKCSLRVNLSKSFFRGHFRESCGGDYLFGNDVAPCRLRLAGSRLRLDGLSTIMAHDGKHRASLILGIERHCRELVKHQLYGTASVLYKVIEGELGTKLPLVTERSPILGRLAPDDEVYKTLPVDSIGNFRKVTVWEPVPVVGYVRGASPYQKLRSCLMVDSGAKSWVDTIFPTGPSSLPLGTACVPRRVKIQRRTIRASKLF